MTVTCSERRFASLQDPHREQVGLRLMGWEEEAESGEEWVG